MKPAKRIAASQNAVHQSATIGCSLAVRLTLVVISSLGWAMLPASAETLLFPGTPVRSVTIEGSFSQLPDARAIDAGTNIIYQDQNSSNQVGVMLLQAPVPQELRSVLTQQPGPITSEQISNLVNTKTNPWIVRYCAERGTPKIEQLGTHKFLVTTFEQEQRVRTATKNGAICIPATKYEGHAFTVHGDKLVHIYLIANTRDKPDTALTAHITAKFQALLSSVRW